MRIVIRSFGILVVTVAAAVSCGPPPAVGGAGPQHNVLTAAELAPMASVDLYTALQRIRPVWLRSRSPAPMCSGCDATQPGQRMGTEHATPVHVYVNGQRTEGVEQLRLIPVSTVLEVRFYEPQDANTHLGTGNDGGAIDVRVKP